MAKSVSVATRAKISRALKGNKNAFQGGPKPRLSTRQKIANINAAAKAKKANLSSDQIARRQAVAKRLRAQARREEALGGGVPDVIKTNEQLKAETRSTGAQQRVGSLESVKQQAAKTARESNQRRQADRAKQVGTQASAPRSAKQKLNAPQSPRGDKSVKLEDARAELNRLRPSAESYAKFGKAKEALKDLPNKEYSAGISKVMAAFRSEHREYHEALDRLTTAEKREIARLDARATQFEKFQAEQKTLHEPLNRGGRAGELGSDNIVAPGTRSSRGPIVPMTPQQIRRAGKSKAEYERMKAARDKPQPPQSDTGSDRSGTFTKKVPVKSQKATRPTGRKAIETEQDLDDFKADVVIPNLVKKLSRDVPSDVMERFRKESIEDTVAKFRKEGGGDATDAIEFLFKEFG